jgi:hypothetical protein
MLMKGAARFSSGAFFLGCQQTAGQQKENKKNKRQEEITFRSSRDDSR